MIFVRFPRLLKYIYTSLIFATKTESVAIVYKAITVLSRGIKHFDRAYLSGVMIPCEDDKKEMWVDVNQGEHWAFL